MAQVTEFEIFLSELKNIINIADLKDSDIEKMLNFCKASNIIDELRAIMINNDEEYIKDFTCLASYISQSIDNESRKNKKTYLPNNINNNHTNTNTNTTTKDIDKASYNNNNYIFYNKTIFNEINNTYPTRINTRNMNISRFPESIIDNYSIIPKSNEDFLVNYRESYFKYIRQSILKSHNIEDLQDKEVTEAKLYNYNVYVIIISNTDNDFNQILLMDPINEYSKYNAIFDECESLIKNDYLFYNGQIVVVSGLIVDNKIIINNLVQGFPIVTYNIKEDSLIPYYKEHAPYLISIIYGPFFDNNSIDLTLYIRCLKELKNKKSNVVIIGGPFIPSYNNVFNSGSIKIKTTKGNAYFNIFQYFQLMIETINDVFKDTRTLIIIVPSLDDLMSVYPIPQPSYDTQFLNINDLEIVKQKRLNFIGNPEIIQINELIIGITNYELLHNILSNSVKKNNSNTLDLLLESFLKQRSLMPIIPSIIKDDDSRESTIPVDVKKLNNIHFEVLPDIVITPFKKVQFARKNQDTIFINPYKVVNANEENQELGSFVNIYLLPPSKNGTKVNKRLIVDKVKISDN